MYHINNFIIIYLTILLFITFFGGKLQSIVSLPILPKSPGGWKIEKETSHSGQEMEQREICSE